MPDARCAVAVFSTGGGDADRAIRSVETAAAASRGEFSGIDVFPVHCPDRLEAFREAAERAVSTGCDWLILLSDAESAVPDIFAKTVPARRLHDAIWGGAGVIRADGSSVPLERITRLAAWSYEQLFHLALRWWIGPSHFVRPELALQSLSAAPEDGGYAAYLLQLWRTGKAFKAAHALTVFHDALPPLAGEDREHFLTVLDEEPVFTTVRHGALTVRLPYTGRNPVIERDHTRGHFFEGEELGWLHSRLPAGMRVVDAGANTGNHTVFFGAAMQASTVLPIEPDPRASQAIRRAVEANGLGNVDLRLLGAAVGEGQGRMRAVFSEGGGLGATRLVPDAAGPIEVNSLDRLVDGRVDLLKIDVEGMEMAVLRGAEAMLERDRPYLFVEVVDGTIPEFLAWVDSRDYRIEKLFPDKAHSNYFVAPLGDRPSPGVA